MEHDERGSMTGWDPWREADGVPHVSVAWERLPAETGGAAVVERDGWVVVFLDPQLPASERTAALAHELIHVERAGGAYDPAMPDTWGPVVAREERRVDYEAARRLLPVARLLEAAEVVADLGGHVTAEEFAAEFELPVAVAERAMLLLGRETDLERHLWDVIADSA